MSVLGIGVDLVENERPFREMPALMENNRGRNLEAMKGIESSVPGFLVSKLAFVSEVSDKLGS